MKVRPAEFSDSKEIISIWNPYIKNTFVTFNASEKSQEDIIKSLKYVLGSDENDSYFYVAEAGGKMTWIPSIKRLSQYRR